MSRRQFLKGVTGVFVLSGLSLGKGYYNTFHSQIRLEQVQIKIPNLPSSFKGLRIAQISDLHSSSIVSQESIVRAVELAMEQKPDLIVLTGDYIGEKAQMHIDEIHEFHREYLDKCVDALSYLKAPMGIFAVLGNHDYWAGPEATQAIHDDLKSKLGVTWLRNSNVLLKYKGQEIALMGVEDYWEKSCSLGDALKGTDKKTKVLLSHNPDINEIIFPFQNIDLVLSGHTHGGQIAFPFIGTPFYPGLHGQKYRRGLVRDGARQTYINRGVGHLVIPVRFNSPPEVTLITLI
ncbi:metallophosphoesterase [Candidatus Nitromaritima sp. SCGC AAA799-A02]|nr:metallophosphoesterase [Candidatus Nitromaritima sp. SCGC AAA799-C22]KMP12400.1 metallophosphoesterase [Candidatus Nitromaritima sp. SCGC AAA799-A02]